MLANLATCVWIAAGTAFAALCGMLTAESAARLRRWRQKFMGTGDGR